MKYETYLFDWDGTLAQTLHLWPDALDESLKRRGIVLAQRDLVRACGGVAAFLKAHVGLPEEEGMQVLLEAIEYVKTHSEDVELYPGALELLEGLKRTGKKCAVVTSSIREVVELMMCRRGVLELFDTVVCIQDTKHSKPHAEPLLRALELVGGSRESAVMIGDTDKDIVAGHNAGVDTVLFYPPYHDEFYEYKEMLNYRPGVVVRELAEIMRL